MVALINSTQNKEILTCRMCGESKPIEMFKKSKDYKNGYSTLCKKCHNEKNKKYPVNKDRLNKKRKEWRVKNSDKAKLYQRKSQKKRWESGKIQEYRKLNRDRLLDVKRKWRAKNNEKENKRTQAWRINNPDKYKESDKRSKNKRKDINLKWYVEWSRKNRTELGDYYCKSLLKKKSKKTNKQIINSDIISENPMLIEIKRLIVKTKRLCKTLENCAIN